MYPCIAHTQEILDDYFFELDKVFAQIRDFEDGKDVMKSLDGPISVSYTHLVVAVQLVYLFSFVPVLVPLLQQGMRLRVYSLVVDGCPVIQ